jgi:hypothetical protein
MIKIIKVLGLSFITAIIIFIFLNFYPNIFAKTIVGEIVGVDRVVTPMTLLTQGNQPPPAQIFSFAVAIRDEKSGEIFTASSEDRQWAVVEKGFCAKAKFLVYPPWALDKAGTYYGARLLRLYDCKNKPKDAE